MKRSIEKAQVSKSRLVLVLRLSAFFDSIPKWGKTKPMLSWVTLSARLKVDLFTYSRRGITQCLEVRRSEVATYLVLGCHFFRIIPFMGVKKISRRKISLFTSWQKWEIRQVSLKIRLQVRTFFLSVLIWRKCLKKHLFQHFYVVTSPIWTLA